MFDWQKLNGDLDTGDVILFHSPDMISTAIDVVTHSHFSHVGMVVKDPKLTGLPLSLWQSFEPDGGVVVDPLPDFLRKYHHDDRGSFAIRHLQIERTPAMLQALATFMNTVKGRHFPSATGMAWHWVEGKLGINSGEKTFFCADLVADTWQHMGILDSVKPANGYAPSDFAYRTDMPFKASGQLGELVRFRLGDV